MVDSRELQELTQEIHALKQRVTSLENTAKEHRRESMTVHESAVQSEDSLWALSGLRSRLQEHPSTAQGAVMLVGSVTLPTGTPVAWQQATGTSGLFDVEWSDRSAALNALGHPVRLELLRHILSGVHGTSELAAIEALGTTGQLHHHLRQLLSTGWVKQSGRGVYEVPASRIIPLLACLIAVGG